jgi:hypothetical protein
MAIAFNEIFGSGVAVNLNSSTNTTTYSTGLGGPAADGRFLPDPYDLVVVPVWMSDTNATATCVWRETVPGSYPLTLVANVAYDTTGTPLHRMFLFVAQRKLWTGGAGVAQQLTVDVSADAATGCAIRPFKLTGTVDATADNGVSALRQVVTGGGNATANPTLTMSALETDALNAVLFMVGTDVNPPGGTAEASWTEWRDTGYTTPPTGEYFMYRLATTDNTPTVTAAAQDWGAVAVEVRAPASPQVVTLIQDGAA